MYIYIYIYISIYLSISLSLYIYIYIYIYYYYHYCYYYYYYYYRPFASPSAPSLLPPKSGCHALKDTAWRRYPSLPWTRTAAVSAKRKFDSTNHGEHGR